jgi:hypothetical protein
LLYLKEKEEERDNSAAKAKHKGRIETGWPLSEGEDSKASLKTPASFSAGTISLTG